MKKLRLLVIPFLLVGLVGCGKGEAKESQSDIYHEIGERNSNGEVEGRFTDADGKINSRTISDSRILYPRNHKFIKPDKKEIYIGGEEPFNLTGISFKVMGSYKRFSDVITNGNLFRYIQVGTKDDLMNNNDKFIQAISKYNLKIEKISKKHYKRSKVFSQEEDEMATTLASWYLNSSHQTILDANIEADNPDWLFIKYYLGYYEMSVAFNELLHELNTGDSEQEISELMSNILYSNFSYYYKFAISGASTNGVSPNEDHLSGNTKLNDWVNTADKYFSKEIAEKELKLLAENHKDIMLIPQDICPID